MLPVRITRGVLVGQRWREPGDLAAVEDLVAYELVAAGAAVRVEPDQVDATEPVEDVEPDQVDATEPVEDVEPDQVDEDLDATEATADAESRDHDPADDAPPQPRRRKNAPQR